MTSESHLVLFVFLIWSVSCSCVILWERQLFTKNGACKSLFSELFFKLKEVLPVTIGLLIGNCCFLFSDVIFMSLSKSLLICCCLRHTSFTLFPDSATQPNSFQNGGCQLPIGRNHHTTLILDFLWQFNNTVFFSFLFLSSSLHLSSSFKLHVFMSCLNFPVLENLTSSTLPLRLLKFFLHLTAPFQVNFSCLLTGDQSGFIQLYTKWDLLCVSLLGLCSSLELLLCREINILLLSQKKIKHLFVLVVSILLSYLISDQIDLHGVSSSTRKLC